MTSKVPQESKASLGNGWDKEWRTPGRYCTTARKVSELMEVVVVHTVNLLAATELFTLKGLLLCYVNFTSIG